MRYTVYKDVVVKIREFKFYLNKGFKLSIVSEKETEVLVEYPLCRLWTDKKYLESIIGKPLK